MSVAADGGGVTLGTIVAVEVGSGVGLELVWAVEVTDAVGELDAGVVGVGEPGEADEGLVVGPPVDAVGEVEAVGVAVAGVVGVVVGLTLGVGVGGAPVPVSMTYIASPVGVWPKTIIWPEVGDWCTLFGLTDRVTTGLAFRSNGAQPAGSLAGHTSLTGAWRTTIEPSVFVLTQATSAWGTLIGVGTRFGVAEGPRATADGEPAGPTPMSMLPSRKPTTMTAAIEPSAPTGAHRPRGNARTVDPVRRRAGRDRRPPPDRACSTSSATEVRAHRSRGGGTTRIARRYSRSLR